MDTKLLNALNNIGDALDALVEALNDKASSKSEAGAALQTGDFGKQLESISKDIKSIKADTQEILKQQKTILSTAKEKEKDSKMGIMDSLGGDDSMMKNIAKGIGVIMLLAVAVLAIGIAFKLVGKVDILSVIGLAIGITLISIAFEKVANLKIGLKEAAITSGVLVIVSAAIMLSSWFLSGVKPLSLGQIITGGLIAGMFALVSPSIGKMIKALDGVGWITLIKSVIFLPIILPAIALGIALSSEVLQNVKSIGISQFISTILISGIFVVLSFGLKNMMGAFKGIDPVSMLLAALFLPTILVAVSQAIVDSSEVLKDVKMISLGSFFGAIMVSAIFVVLSFGLKNILKSLKGLDPDTAVISAFVLPLLLIAMSAAIWGSSELLSNVVPITFSQFLTSIAISAVFVVLSFAISIIAKSFSKMSISKAVQLSGIAVILFIAMSFAIMLSSHILAETADIEWMKLLKILAFSIIVSIAVVVVGAAAFILAKVFKLENLVKGAIAIVTLALAIMTASLILSEGKYDIYPGWEWSLLTALSVGVFGLVAWGLNKIGSISDYIKGGFSIIIISGVIMVSSHILNIGKYEKYPSLDWILGVGASIAAFGIAAVLLGTQALNPFFYAGLGVTLLVIGTIMVSSHILNIGKYEKYPSLDWILGVGASLGSFGIAAILLGTQAINPFFYAGLGMTLLVAGTIVSVAKILSGGNYKLDGFLEWAIGVALLYATFTPIILVLGAIGLANAVISFFGPDPWKMANGMILDIASTIVGVSFVLAKGNWQKGPTQEWAEGVAIAIGAFSQVYAMLINSKSIKALKDVGPKEFTEAIETVIDGIISAANKLAGAKTAFENPPPYEWALGVGEAIGAFAPVYTGLMLAGFTGKEDFGPEAMVRGVQTMTEGIIAAAKTFAKNTAPFEEGKYPSVEWGEGVGAALGAFAPVFEALQNKRWWKSDKGVIDGMVNGILRISGALVDSARAFAGYEFDWQTLRWKKGEDLSSMWGAYPSEDWAIGVGNSVTGFLDIFDEIENRGYTTAQFSILSQVLNYGLSSMSSAARTLWRNKKYFDVELNPDFIENIARNVLGFAKLGLALDRMLVSEKIITKESSGFMGVVGASKETETVRETKDLGIVDMVVGNLVRVAKTLFFNKKYFEDTSVYDTFYKDVVSPSGIIWRFTRLGSYLSRMKTFYQGMWRVRTAAWRLVDVGEILYKGKDYFGMSIDPNYMKNVGQNILDFNEIVKQLIESEGGKGFWDKVGGMASGLLGTDPISQIARRMITLSEGYDKLANSLIKLGTAMRMLNISDVSKLGGLTKTIITGEESRDISSSFKGSSPTMQTGDTSLFENFFSKDEEDDEFVGEDPITSRLDQVIDLLTSINNNTVNINEFIELQSEGEIESPTDVGA